uniref:uncharacterized protein LOC120337554 isoform X1 n=1 Tax=Styela clava TaxID=7725 RepID=UPI00193AB5DB|nr:uncharacterized protein LOC120337554 isoform X1 [Styela clava]XP_039261311.1 uncharacterized protein LOC120337554 isoform X1 [Styela clava]
MVKTKNQSSANMEDERMSMNSLGNLHGRVDFFGIETRRANKPIYQKMKVMQTWIFIQSVATTLMIAYLILLTVWLAPFFPMNYDTDDDVDDNTAAISSLQSNLNETDEQVNNNTNNIDDLEEWRTDTDREIDEMNATINYQQDEIDELYNQTDYLNQTVIELQSEIYVLENKTRWQQIEIIALAVRLAELEKQQIANAVDAAAGIARADRRAVEYDRRITELECFDKKITIQVDDLSSSTKEQFCNVTKSLGTISGQVRDNQEINDIRDTITTAKFEEVNDTLTQILSDIDSIETQQDVDEQKLQDLNETFINETQDLQNQITELHNYTVQVAGNLEQAIENQIDHAIWAVNSFKEQDDMREAAIEAERIERESGLLKLQCSLDEVNQTLNSKIDSTEQYLEDWTMQQVNLTRQMLEDDVGQLQSLVEDTKINMTKLIDATADNLQEEINETNIVVKKEAATRELQYVHLCDQIHIVNAEVNETNEALASNVIIFTDDINQLNQSVEDLQTIQANHTTEIKVLQDGLFDHELTFVMTQRSTTQSLIQLRNETCELQNEISSMEKEHKLFDNRMDNADKRLTANRREFKEDIVNVKADFTISIALLNQSNNDALQSAIDAELAVAQLVTDLGENIPELYAAIMSILPEAGTPRPTGAPPPVTRPVAEADFQPPPGTTDDAGTSDHDYDYGRYNFKDSE